MAGRTASGGGHITTHNFNALIDSTLRNSPDMQVAEQRIQLAEAQAKAVEAAGWPGDRLLPQTLSVRECQLRADGDRLPLPIRAAGTTGPWYTNEIPLVSTAGWNLDLQGKKSG